jgi:precorrin-2/cobalt-factor-2 C20-methyltransferase
VKVSKGILFIVGVGPGDPELMTLKALRALERCETWLAPTAKKNGSSTALDIVKGAMDCAGKEILFHHFPMKKIHRGQNTDPEVKEAWQQAVELIRNKLEAGESVALLTLGDPAIYSTGLYVCETLLACSPEAQITIIPGISAIGATAAAASQPLCLGDERLMVIPATFTDDNIRETLEKFDVVVFMKVYKSMDRLVPILEELHLLDKAVLVERTSMDNQKVRHDVKAALGKKLHYFSTMIVRKN